MKKYTAVYGGDMDGIYIQNGTLVLSAMALRMIGIDLMAVIRNDWSDAAIESAIEKYQDLEDALQSLLHKRDDGMIGEQEFKIRWRKLYHKYL